MNLIKRNKILICFSQLGAWALLIAFSLSQSLNKFLYPIVNNRPAAFTISIWLIQILLVMNAIVYVINYIWIRSNSSGNKSDMKLQIKKVAKLHMLVSICHVMFVCVSIFMIFGGEDL